MYYIVYFPFLKQNKKNYFPSKRAFLCSLLESKTANFWNWTRTPRNNEPPQPQPPSFREAHSSQAHHHSIISPIIMGMGHQCKRDWVEKRPNPIIPLASSESMGSPPTSLALVEREKSIFCFSEFGWWWRMESGALEDGIPFCLLSLAKLGW